MNEFIYMKGIAISFIFTSSTSFQHINKDQLSKMKSAKLSSIDVELLDTLSSLNDSYSSFSSIL